MLLPALLVTTLLRHSLAEINNNSEENNSLIYPHTTAVAANSFALLPEVHRAIAKFRKLNEEEDVVESFDRLGEHSRKLITVGRPMGALLIAGKTSDWKENSEEAKTLVELHELFDAAKRCSDESEDTCYSYSYGLDYIYKFMANLTSADRRIRNETNKITGVLYEMFIPTIYLVDPYFAYGFYTIHDSGTILRTIDYDDLINCRKPTNKEMAKLVRVRDAFERLGARINNTLEEVLNFSWDFNTKEILRFSMRAPAEYVDTMVRHIDQVNETTLALHRSYWTRNPTASERRSSALYNAFASAMTDCYYKLKDLGWASSCELGTTYEFNPTVLLSELRKVRADFLRLILLFSAFGTSPRSYDRPLPQNYNMTENALLGLEKTGRNIADWARDIQALSWPDIGIDVAKTAIGSEPIPSDICEFNDIATKVQNALAKQGPKSYSYQVLVARAMPMNVSWAVATEDSDQLHTSSYTNITDFNGLDIHIFRFNSTQAEARATKAKQWMHERREAVLRTIEVSELRDASDLLAYLHSEPSISPIYGNDFFRSVILIRSDTISSQNTRFCDIIPIGLAISCETSATVETRNDKNVTYYWKAYFFL